MPPIDKDKGNYCTHGTSGVRSGLGGSRASYKWNKLPQVKLLQGNGNRVCKKDDTKRNKINVRSD